MSRFIRRSVAPLLAGALAASVVVAVGDGVLPFDGVLTQAESPPTGSGAEGPSATTGFDLFDPESLEPIEDLDLDAVVAEPSPFDTDSVFVDLSDVGDFFGIYGYGSEERVDAAGALRDVAPPGRADDFEGVTAEAAADRFLLSSRCNALFALGIREQVTRPITARILREDQELVMQLEQLVNGDPIPPEFDVDPLQALPRSRVVLDPEGRVLARPLDSTVTVGEVTVSAFDPDLVRAREPELLHALAAGPGAATVEEAVTPDSLVTPEVIQAVWQDCLVRSARERTQPVPRTINGEPVFTLTLDDPPVAATDPTASGTEIVTWLEEGLEIRVETDFDAVSDAIRANPSVEFDTRTWLETFADPVEVAFEVASLIVTRRAEPTDVVVREAFAPPAGLEFGEPLAGAEGRVKDALASEAGALADDDAAEAFPGNFGNQVQRVVARPQFQSGQVAENAGRLFLTPIGPGAVRPFILPDGIVHQVVWDPEFLNSDPFRKGWRLGIADGAHAVVGFETLVDALADVDALLEEPEVQEVLDDAGIEDDRRRIVAESVEELVRERLGVVDVVAAVRDGTTFVHWLAPCYSVTAIAAVDFPAVMDSQAEARRRVFGLRPATLVGVPSLSDEGPADDGPSVAEEPDDVAEEVAVDVLRRRLLDALGELLAPESVDLGAVTAAALQQASADPDASTERFLQQLTDAYGPEGRDQRAEEDALRTARCSPNNLQVFNTGFPVTDADLNGIDDRLPENDV